MTSRLISAASEPAASAPSPEGSCRVEPFGPVSITGQVKGGISDATPAMISSRTESRMKRFQLIATSHAAKRRKALAIAAAKRLMLRTLGKPPLAREHEPL